MIALTPAIGHLSTARQLPAVVKHVSVYLERSCTMSALRSQKNPEPNGIQIIEPMSSISRLKTEK